MGKTSKRDLSRAFFFSSGDDELDDIDDYDFEGEDSYDDIESDENIYDEDEELEIIDIDDEMDGDMDGDMDDDESDESEEDEVLQDEEQFDSDYEDGEVDDEHSEIRRDIWSNIDWDKD